MCKGMHPTAVPAEQSSQYITSQPEICAAMIDRNRAIPGLNLV